MKVAVYNSQKDLRISKKSVCALVKAVLQQERTTHEEVSIYFVSVKKICQLHTDLFDDPTQTDCISCPLDEKHLGEIFVAPKTAIEYAGKRDLSPYDELTLYVVHGILHCLGYDDIDPKDRRAMRKKERSCMAFIKQQELTITP